MNNNEMKNCATDLNELWKSDQLLEYARSMFMLYNNYSKDVILGTLGHLKNIQESE